MACQYLFIDVCSPDISSAVGNVNYLNNTVYVSYYDCFGANQIDYFTIPGSGQQTTFCYDDSYGLVTIYYYQYDYYYAATCSYYSAGSSCGGPSTPTPTPIPPTPTPTNPESCYYLFASISSTDISQAYGNISDPSNNGIVYIDYRDCFGGYQTESYSAPGNFQTDFCYDGDYGIPVLYYYQYDTYQTAFNSSYYNGSSCGGVPTPTPTPTTTTTPTRTPRPDCPDRRVVIQVCNSNSQIDDNFDVYLNGSYIGYLDLDSNSQVGSIFIGDADTNITVTQPDFTCPLNNMVTFLKEYTNV